MQNTDPVKIRPLNCINCGAPVSSSKCEYCDTVYSDFNDLIADQKIEELKKDLSELRFMQEQERQMMMFINNLSFPTPVPAYPLGPSVTTSHGQYITSNGLYNTRTMMGW